MRGSKKQAWIGGTAFAAALLLAATWFLLVSPNLAKASETRADAEQARVFNDVLQLKLTKLRADFDKLGDYKAELAEAQEQIPAAAQLETYLDGLDAIAERRSVTITAMTAGTPEEFVIPDPEPAPGSTPTAEPTEAADESDSAEKPEKPKGPEIPKGLTAIPVSVTVLGTYVDTMKFLDDVHQKNPRVFLVSALTGTSQKKSEGSQGKPATEAGDQELIITGYIYVLPNAIDLTGEEPVDEPTDLPRNDGKNPLLPVTGE